jgi:gluconokinase
VTFCEVDAPPEVIADRISHRKGHYMPPSLLPSQLATLQPLADDEPGVNVSAADTPDQIVRHALAKLGLTEEAEA